MMSDASRRPKARLEAVRAGRSKAPRVSTRAAMPAAALSGFFAALFLLGLATDLVGDLDLAVGGTVDPT